MSTFKTALTFIIGLGFGGGGAVAYQNQTIDMAEMKTQDPMAGIDHSTMDMPASTTAYQAAMDTMMKDMVVPYSGNADLDFAKGMIPHHKGAIDMARVVLQYGKDTEIRKLAEGVVAAQESEISFLQNWLKANPK
jgi:uncharacterized protein (DUF305 family)